MQLYANIEFFLKLMRVVLKQVPFERWIQFMIDSFKNKSMKYEKMEIKRLKSRLGQKNQNYFFNTRSCARGGKKLSSYNENMCKGELLNLD